MGKPNAYDDIPGTTVFDAQRSRQGYHLNMFCMSLMKAENREAFKANERAYLDRWPMTEEQKQAVLDRDWNGMIDRWEATSTTSPSCSSPTRSRSSTWPRS